MEVINLQKLKYIVPITLIVGVILVFPSCSHHYEFNGSDIKVSNITGKTTLNGLTFKGQKIWSYTALDGVQKSSQTDYRLVQHQSDNFEYYVHKNYDETARSFLNIQHFDNTVFDNLERVLSWLETQYSHDLNVKFEIVLVPSGYNYNYVSGYSNKEGLRRVRFGFHYDIENAENHFETILTVLTHETAHLMHQFSSVKPPNNISDEVVSLLSETCAFSAVLNKVPKNHLLNVSDGDITKLNSGPFSKNIVALKSAGNSDFIIATLIAKTTINHLLLNSELNVRTSEDKIADFCDEGVYLRNDYELKLLSGS